MSAVDPIDDPNSVMEREPVRLPVWVATVLVALINLGIDLLSEVEWRAALIGVLVTVGGLIGAGEVARSRTWAPSSVRRVRRQALANGYEQALNEVRALDADHS